ncbi:hypothetical protein V1478_012390, partial [Vespula squamosa]
DLWTVILQVSLSFISDSTRLYSFTRRNTKSKSWFVKIDQRGDYAIVMQNDEPRFFIDIREMNNMEK